MSFLPTVSIIDLPIFPAFPAFPPFPPEFTPTFEPPCVEDTKVVFEPQDRIKL